MSLHNIELIIEKGDSGIWGRVNYNNNLIVEEADNLDTLQLNLKMLLKDFEGLEPESAVFDIRYDVYALFRQFDFLNISKVAKHACIHPGLPSPYTS